MTLTEFVYDIIISPHHKIIIIKKKENVLKIYWITVEIDDNQL